MTAGAFLWGAVVAAEVVALTLCLVNPRTRRSGLAALLMFAIASDVVTAAGKALLFTDPEHPVKVAIDTFGWPARAWYHVETFLVLGWPALLSLTVRRAFVFPGSHPGPSAAVIGMWLGMSGGLVLVFPQTGAFTHRVFLGVELLSVAFAWLAVWQGWGRAWSRSATHMALVWMLCFETVVLLLGPFSHDLYRDWALLARVPYMLSFGTASWILARALRRGAEP